METKNDNNDSSDAIKSKRSCKAIYILAYVSTFLLILTNIFLAYLMVEYFKKDGFSLSVGLFIGAFYIITLPANILSIFMIKKVKTGEKPAPLFYLVLGLATTMTGIILQNAISHWIYIFLYGVILSAAAVVCMSSQKRIRK